MSAPQEDPAFINETKEKWNRVRNSAITFLALRTEKYLALKQARRARLVECVLYIGFTIIFSYVIIAARDTSKAFNHAQGVREYLIGTEIPSLPGKTFDTVATISELWFWINEVLVERVIWSQGNDLRYPILGNNQFIGPIRIRQARVMELQCKMPPALAYRGSNCYNEYSDATMERRKNPPGTSWPLYGECARMSPTLTDCRNWTSYNPGYGWVPIDSFAGTTYGGGGYEVELPVRKSDTLLLLKDMQKYEWLNDNFTRAVFFEFVLYNPNSNLFLSTLLAVEIPPSGGMVPSTALRVVDLYPQGRKSSQQATALFYLVFGMVIVMTVAEILMVLKHGRDFLKDGYNLITVINIIFFFIVYILDLNSLTTSSKILSKTSNVNDPAIAVKIHQTAYIAKLVYNFNAFNAFLAWLRCLKYMDLISDRTERITATLSACASSVAALLVIFGIFYAGFSIAFFAAFGQDLYRFRTMGMTCLSLFDILMGGGNLQELVQYNKVLGPLLFVSFVVLMALVLLNMFLAIIVQTYSHVCERMEKDQSEVSSSVRWVARKGARSLLKMIFGSGKKKNVVEKQKDDSLLNESELRIIWETDHDAFEVMGISRLSQFLDIADTTGENEMELSAVQDHDKKLDGNQDQGTNEEISHLLMKLLERTSAVMLEQKKLRGIVEGSRPTSRVANAKP
ncbi:hypothetical protein GUITHDRAFT_115828 [Guillardia theta CCMP2712]|uniref:Uncharacterized protein n=1 Tax=Guillardia theta (strain CCMP2712) TaxID=905079 RepID=L1IPP5_GUITC|nr:hypothetical protein GUITHDRAFT_115828 [Guillardia theta CCMP2712]EKX38067.1 hypothetical protein GUITHDRAFT_115828 [Guillardia theta CCMP2712]|eukprot:XP_005825047.1 hypothetical protein GUITHDRAFT_115828 [Guillardia theta CCMP2712]